MTLNSVKNSSGGRSKTQSRRGFLTCAIRLCAAAPIATSASLNDAFAKNTDHGLAVRTQSLPVEPSDGQPLLENARPGALATLSENAARRLHLLNRHTGDDVDLVYFVDGIYIQRSLAAFNNLMRDRRANIATDMDVNLYDQLFLLRSQLKTDKPVHILSGYRTPETNAKLRKRSSGVAKYSLHMEGRAADLYVPGFKTRQIQQAARGLEAGGVGIYSNSGFVHMDTGKVRYWGR